MSASSPRACPACKRVALHRPLPPDGFWQEHVLQRIDMYPYRCEACGARFYRRARAGEGLGKARFPAPADGPTPTARGVPKVVAPKDEAEDPLSHEDFVSLIDQISRSERRKGLGVSESQDEDD